MKRKARIQIITLSLIVIAGIALGNCKTSSGHSTGQNKGESTECGECLQIESSRVCTPEGTMDNSCFAICREKKILCQQECPCPEEETKK